MINTAVSDHSLIYVIRKCLKQPKCHKNNYIKKVPNSKLSQFNAEFADTDWSNEMSLQNPDHVLSNFHRRVETIRQKCTTTCKIHIRQNTVPWVTPDILQLLKKKASSLKAYRSLKTPEAKLIFTQFRNKCNFELYKAKQFYFENQINRTVSNPRTLWQTIKSITGENKIKNNNSLQISINGTLLTDHNKIANSFNEYFIASVQELSSRFTVPLFLTSVPAASQQFSFSEIAQNDITNILCSLNASHVCDVNNLNTIFRKTHASTLIPFFHHLVNLCIRQSVFPAMWKMAQITPIFKSEDPTIVSNYRPIAILPTVSKLLEKTLYNQLVNYLENNNLLSDCQHGFRPLRSTMSALLLFTEQIHASLNKGQVTGVIYVDFRKTFDTVNHQILLNKRFYFYFYHVLTKAWNEIPQHIRTITSIRLFARHLMDRYICDH